MTTTKEKSRDREGNRSGGSAGASTNGQRVRYIPNEFEPITFSVQGVGTIHVDGRDEIILAEMKRRGIYAAFSKLMEQDKTTACWIRTDTATLLFAFVGLKIQGGFIRYEAPPTEAGLAVLLHLVSIHVEDGSAIIAEVEVRS